MTFKRTHRRPFRLRVVSEHFGSQTPKPAWIDHSEWEGKKILGLKKFRCIPSAMGNQWVRRITIPFAFTGKEIICLLYKWLGWGFSKGRSRETQMWLGIWVVVQEDDVWEDGEKETGSRHLEGESAGLIGDQMGGAGAIFLFTVCLCLYSCNLILLFLQRNTNLSP